MTDAHIEVINTGVDPIFTNAADGDLAIATATSSQAIHIGTTKGGTSHMQLAQNGSIVTRNSTIITGSNATALSNIIDGAGIWTTLSNNSPNTLTVVSSNPNLWTTSNGSIDLGSNGYFTFSNNGLVAASNITHSNIIQTDFTIEGWVYYYSNPSVNISGLSIVPSLVGNMNPSTNATFWSFGVTSNRELSFYNLVNGVSSAAVYTRSNTISLNTWTHIAMTYSNTPKLLSLYVNGIAQSNLSLYSSAGTPWTLPSGASGTTASNNTINSIGGTQNYVILGRLSTCNNPCYIHDFRMITGTTYVPTPSTINAPLSNVAGTRFLLRAAPVRAQSNVPIVVAPNGFVGVGTSNPQVALDVNGLIRQNADFVATLSGFRVIQPFLKVGPWKDVSSSPFTLGNGTKILNMAVTNYSANLGTVYLYTYFTNTATSNIQFTDTYSYYTQGNLTEKIPYTIVISPTSLPSGQYTLKISTNATPSSADFLSATIMELPI